MTARQKKKKKKKSDLRRAFTATVAIYVYLAEPETYRRGRRYFFLLGLGHFTVFFAAEGPGGFLPPTPVR